ncbi:MAG: glycosyl hydrolase [Bacteroidia bacterium]
MSDLQIEGVKVNNGELITGGTNYKTLVLPAVKYLPLKYTQRNTSQAETEQLWDIHKALPESVPGLGNLNERQAEFQELVESLAFREMNKMIKQATVGSGSVILGEDIDELLDYAGVEPEEMANQGLQYARRKYENGHYYFISNWSGTEVDRSIPIQTEAQSVIIFDPMSGEKGLAKVEKKEEGQTEVYLQIAQGQSLILITSNQKIEESNWNYHQKSDQVISLDGEWEINFISGGPTLPAMRKTEYLTSWTEMGGDYQYFSGTASYKKDFPKPEGNGWILDLGEVHESAVVKVNGTEIGTLIGPTYQIFIDPGLMGETNTLEIEVSNLMLNRIIDLDQRSVFWKKFYNVNFPPRRAEHRGRNGLFDAADIPLAPSGLLGPIRLVNVSPM